MPIEDCFRTGNSSAPLSSWSYDPSKKYLVGIENRTDLDSKNSYTCRFFDIDNNSWNNGMDTTAGQTSINAYGYFFEINGKFYVGTTYGTPWKFGVYDPVTDTWTQLTNPTLPMFKNCCSTRGDNNDAYVLFSDGTLWRYDSVIDSWNQLANPPTFASYGGLISRIGGTLWYFNGTTGHSYDIATNQWTPNATTAPSSHLFSGGIGTSGSLIYYWDNGTFRSFDGAVWNVLANGYGQEGSGSITIGGSNIDVYNGKVYCSAVKIAGKAYGGVGVYDILINTWDILPETDVSLAEGIQVL